MDQQNCRVLFSSLSEFVDGTLEEELCAEIRRHMEGCENCRVVVDSLQKTIYIYQTTRGPAEVPEDVRQRLYKRLDLDRFFDKH